MKNKTMQTEPLVTIGTIGSLVAALIVLLRSFGVPLTDDQSDAINQFVAIAAPIIIALVGRQFVFSRSTVDDVESAAYSAGQQAADRGAERIP